MTLNDWMKDIKKVARRAAFDWPGVAEEEDLVQEVCLHILEAPGTQEDLTEMDQTSRYRTLHKIAQRIASKERTDYERFTGDFRYSVDEVRGLLESSYDPEASSVGSSWSSGDYTRSGSGHSDSTADTALRNLPMTESRNKLREALAALKISNTKQYDALMSRFGEGIVPDRNDRAAFEVIDRGLVSVTTKMNHAHKRQYSPTGGGLVPGKTLGDGPGSRKPVSSSAARYLSKEGWDADYVPATVDLRNNHIEKEVWE